MTKATKPVDREVRIKGKPWVARLTSAGLLYRAKGRRTWYGPLAHESAMHRAAEIQAEAKRRERAQRRRVRRGLV